MACRAEARVGKAPAGRLATEVGWWYMGSGQRVRAVRKHCCSWTTQNTGWAFQHRVHTIPVSKTCAWCQTPRHHQAGSQVPKHVSAHAHPSKTQNGSILWLWLNEMIIRITLHEGDTAMSTSTPSPTDKPGPHRVLCSKAASCTRRSSLQRQHTHDMHTTRILPSFPRQSPPGQPRQSRHGPRLPRPCGHPWPQHHP